MAWLPWSLVAGVCVALSGAPRDWPWLAFLGAPLLWLAIERAGTRMQAFIAGATMGTVANAIALAWMVGLLQRFGDFPWALAVLASVLLWVGQGMAFGAAGWAAHAVRHVVPMWAALPATLVGALSLWPGLFSWRLAATQASWPAYIQLAEIGGEPLLDLLVALGGCLTMQAIRKPTPPTLVAALALFVVPIAYGMWRLPQVRDARAQAPVRHIGVIQPNIGIDAKRNPGRNRDSLQRLQSMSARLEARGAQLVVWPETAYPYRVLRERRRDTRGVRAMLARGVRGPLLAGAVMVSRERDRGHRMRFNSVIAVARDGRFLDAADKVELVAFSEYVPLWDYIPALQRRFHPGFTPGPSPRVLHIADTRIGPLICYEDVLPRFVRQLAQRDPDLLINVTNDAWFGDTAEPYLHHAVARLRAVETRRDLIRAVNTGVSGHIAATGEDLIRTETFEKASFVAEAPLLQGETPWVRFGDWVTPCCLGLLLAAAFASWSLPRPGLSRLGPRGST